MRTRRRDLVLELFHSGNIKWWRKDSAVFKHWTFYYFTFLKTFSSFVMRSLPVQVWEHHGKKRASSRDDERQTSETLFKCHLWTFDRSKPAGGECNHGGTKYFINTGDINTECLFSCGERKRPSSQTWPDEDPWLSIWQHCSSRNFWEEPRRKATATI